MKDNHTQFGIAIYRDMEKKLEELLMNKGETFPEILMAYLLLNHVLTILTGDVRYHEKSKSLCSEIFEKISQVYDTLESLLENPENKRELFYRKLKEAVRTYLVNVKKINVALSQVE